MGLKLVFAATHGRRPSFAQCAQNAASQIRFVYRTILLAAHLCLFMLELFGVNLVLCSGARAQAQVALPISQQQPIFSASAQPTAAWVEFCQRLPVECTTDLSEPAIMALPPAVWRTISSINKQVNTAIRPITDEDHWGVHDRWDFPIDGYGDCEDYQILKRKLLVEAGLPRRAMRMAVVIDEAGQGHAVLMVRTDRGEFVLDNKTDAILAWNKTGYTYVSREADSATTWVSLREQNSPVSTANR
jgi:predicted transglutaminase-like cysteine proteinase